MNIPQGSAMRAAEPSMCACCTFPLAFSYGRTSWTYHRCPASADLKSLARPTGPITRGFRHDL
jgi:hypothetical protein